ncbi:aspartyl-phosphate phosphatase Spo0E family protein [Niallia circulans]|uniref:Aspartyl-phosphate phosphatase Spo0E family protein n=1 Tax=Niallia circulans TaxID=1397 RepID=A0A553SMA3_NIACI|nr:aspartyl-phosphate phosphatase Spo0E family protein [Niallia circulans]TRZ38125.1 aspartyl-phosphate phosphatase Spo0E family protein [Niallia circulans]
MLRDEGEYQKYSLSELLIKINSLRYELLETATRKGLDSIDVLKKSEELDSYIVLYQQLKCKSSKNK